MPITITSEINPILHCVFGDNGLLQCRIGLISEVIVIGIVNPMPLFPSLFSQSYPLIFSQKVFALVEDIWSIWSPEVYTTATAITVTTLQ